MVRTKLIFHQNTSHFLQRQLTQIMIAFQFNATIFFLREVDPKPVKPPSYPVRNNNYLAIPSTPLPLCNIKMTHYVACALSFYRSQANTNVFLWNGHSVLAFLPIVFISAQAWAQLSIEVACNTLTPRLSTLRWWCCSCSSLPNKRPRIHKRVIWFQMLQLKF